MEDNNNVMIIRRSGLTQEGSNQYNNIMSSSGDHHHQQQQIPIWIGSEYKLLNGINKLTTCSEIIQSLITCSDDPSKFVIVEKWRKMERKLDPNVRILKVWKEWGDQKNDVALILRHYHSSTSSSSTTTTYSNTTTNDGYIDKRGCSNKMFRRKSTSSHNHHHHHHHHKNNNKHMTNNNRSNPTCTNIINSSANNHNEKCVKSSSSNEEVQMTESMERILSLVLTQGETIQAQLKKLRTQEEQIERYEEQMHKIRSLKDGENYVVESYLNEEINSTNNNNSNNNMQTKGLFRLSRSGSNTNTNTNSKKRGKSPKKLSTLINKSKSKDKVHTRRVNGKIVIDGCSNIALEQFNLTSSHSTSSNNNKQVQNIDGRLEPCSSSDEIPSSSTANKEVLMQQNEILEQICQVNGELTCEEERIVKIGLKIKKYQQKEEPSSNNPNNDNVDGDDDEVEDEGEENENELQEAHRQKYMNQLNLELEALRAITNEQSYEIEQNELHLTEIESILDEKHDCIVHLTYEIQLLDVESDFLQQRLLQITKPLQQQQQHYATISNHNNNSFASPSSSTSQFQPPPYEQAIVASSLANTYLFNYNNHNNSPGSIYNEMRSCNNNEIKRCESDLMNDDSNGVSIPAIDSIPSPNKSIEQINCRKCFNCSELNNYCKCTSNNNNISTNNRNSNTTTTATTTTTIPTNNELSLHLKSTCSSSNSSRDHQDNDSNSDTGISSLHSSGDENTLFTLDTYILKYRL